MPKIHVLDISHHQGTIDFGRVKRSGVEAVILKATQGTSFVDSKFKENLAMARAAGLEVGAYHFLDDSDPILQADHFLDTLRGASGSTPGSGATPGKLIICLDYEGNGQDTPNAYILKRAIARIVQRKGRHPVLYGSDGSMLGPLLRSATCDPDIRSCRRWIARYSIFKPKTPCDLWQFSSKAKVDGCPGRVDANTFLSSEYDSVSAFWRRWEI